MPRIFQSLFRPRPPAAPNVSNIANESPREAAPLPSLPMLTLGQLDKFQQDARLSAMDQTPWIDAYGVNPKTLICVDGQCTRYGLLEFGEFRFIVGPTATPTEGVALTRILKTHPEIGAIFCVEPGAMQSAGETKRYLVRPVGHYLKRLGEDTRAASGAGKAAMSPGDISTFEGSLAHVKFMEFTGMEGGATAISGATLWQAGRGVADYLRQNPGKIALICSEQGISRPCAVIASALLQLQPSDGRQLSVEAIVASVEAQRAQQSGHHIDRARASFAQIAACAELVNTLRSPDGWCVAANRILPSVIDKLPDFAEYRVSVIARWDTPQDYHGPVVPPAVHRSNEIVVFVANGLYFPTQDRRMPPVMRAVDPTGFFAAVYRARQAIGAANARGWSRPLDPQAEMQCIERWRHQVADYLEADFDRAASLLAPTTGATPRELAGPVADQRPKANRT